MDKHECQYMFDEFERMFPTLSRMTITWRPNIPFGIIIDLDDGTRNIYNTLDKTIMGIGYVGESMSEQSWRRAFTSMLTRMLYARGMTQRELAARAGISEFSICNYINRKSSPGVYQIYKIARVLNCHPDQLTWFE